MSYKAALNIIVGMPPSLFLYLQDMSHVRTITTGLSSITAAAYLPASQKLAVSGFSKSIKLFDITSYEQSGDLRDTEFAAMALAAWQEPGRGNGEMLAVGDAGGRLSLMEISVNSLVSRDRRIAQYAWPGLLAF